MKKHLLTAVLCTSLIAAALAGCGSSSSSGSSSTEADSTASAETSETSDTSSASTEAATSSETTASASSDGGDGQTVKLVIGENCADAVDDTVANFEEETGYTVEVTTVPNSSDLYSKLALLMTSEETCPDVITEDGFMVNSDAAAGRLYALDDALADWDDLENFNESILQGGIATDGKMYGVMCSTDTQIIYYNKNLMKEIGIEGDWQPETWDEVLDVAQQLKEANSDKEDFIPLWLWASQTYQEETSMRTFQLFLTGTEGDWPEQLYDESSGKWVVDRDSCVKALNFVNDAFNTYQVAETPAQASDASMSDTIQSDYMMNDNIGLYLSGSWTMGQFNEGNQYEWADAMDVWGFATLPTDDGHDPGLTTISGGWTWAIPALASNKEGGIELLKALCSYDGISERVLTLGESSPRTDVAESDAYQNQGISAIPYTKNQLSYTHFRPTVDGYSAISTTFTQMVEDVAFGSSTPDEAVDMMQEEMIRQFGEDNVIIK